MINELFRIESIENKILENDGFRNRIQLELCLPILACFILFTRSMIIHQLKSVFDFMLPSKLEIYDKIHHLTLQT